MRNTIKEDDPRYCNFTGPTHAEEGAAHARFRARRRNATPAPSQGSDPKYVGTPRHAKHGGGSFAGVPIR
ncbi:MAG TPA: hypothetical protein VHD37_00770 [Candidatus Paceibacterota bacterium]|nr:hypothetical protein [Candidatus Paceibacterota bacterium]